jgi:hypothetical protein
MIPFKRLTSSFLKPLLLILLAFALFQGSYSQDARKGNPGKEERIASIEYSSSGCFSSRSGQINVFRSGDEMYAEFTVNNKRYKAAKLNSAQIASFDRFIKDLRILKEGGMCTTVDTYRVYYGNEFLKKRDASCGWNGFDVLQAALSTNAQAE